MASLTAFIGVLKREIFSATKKTSLKTLLTILVIFALEKMLTTANIYKCPNKGYHLYGGMFIFVPAFCLSGLTLLMNDLFWDSPTSPFRSKYGQKVVCQKICYALVGAFLVGIAWLILAFGTTDFYVCFRVGATKSSSRATEIQSQSTLIAWTMLVSIIALGLLYIAIQKLCFPHHQREYTIHTLREYERLETKAAVSKFEKEIHQLAEQQGEKQVMAILDEVKDGNDAHEVVEKAKNMLLAKYSQTTCSLGNGRYESCLDGVETHGDEKTMLITSV